MNHSIIFSDRQGGKTWAMMTDIHDWVIRGRGRDCLVVFPNLNYLHWWVREWESRFPFAPMIDYVTVNNQTRLRGKWYAKVYVEDVDSYQDGIHDYRLREMHHGVRSHYGDEEMIYSCSPLPLNQRSHNKLTKSEKILSDRLAEAQYKRTVALARMIANMEIHDEEV